MREPGRTGAMRREHKLNMFLFFPLFYILEFHDTEKEVRRLFTLFKDYLKSVR